MYNFSIESNKAMTEICEIGKCHQNAAQQSVLRAKEMFDTLRKNDVCEENEAIQKKSGDIEISKMTKILI